jgi:YidC/Oxa1 family membrane protein insertase
LQTTGFFFDINIPPVFSGSKRTFCNCGQSSRRELIYNTNILHLEERFSLKNRKICETTNRVIEQVYSFNTNRDMPNILYTIIIYPLVLIISTVYKIADDLFNKAGLSIIAVSMAVSFLCLPLYIVAEGWQRLERETLKRLKIRVEKIKAVFSGDERYMMLAAYYRQNHYHPVYALRSSFGLLIQIPFFLAAYTFLSNLTALQGQSFFFISDLGSSDKLIPFGGGTLNILPILMTLINVIAGAIYTRDLSTRDKVQIYGMAALFLLLLYNSPSGLVLYWTMNNIFSLLKNIFYKIKNPQRILYILFSFIVILLDFFLIFIHTGDPFNRFCVVFISIIIPFSPLLLKAARYMLRVVFPPLLRDKRSRTRLYVCSLAIITLLTGYVIPSIVISSSPQEFSYVESITSPFIFLAACFFQSFGLFFFWMLCVYFLFKDKIQTFFCAFTLPAVFIFLINTFFFSGKYGYLSPMLTFENGGMMKPATFSAILNIALILAAAFLVFFLFYKNRQKLLSISFCVVFCALFGISIVNSYTIQREFSRLTAIRNLSDPAETSSVAPIFHLSTQGKNIVVVMLDRAMGGFLPEILAEKPQLRAAYAGFIYYPNTISYSGFTLMGVPPLFGGYEYTPEAMNLRDKEPLVQKHNEALLLLPRIFSESGFNTVVTDPPWANYSWISDTQIYSPYPAIKTYNTKQRYTDIWLSNNKFSGASLKSSLLIRNFLWLSFLKISPLVLRDIIYDNGVWLSLDQQQIDFTSIIDTYSVLDYLPELTAVQNTSHGNFSFIVNELTHEPAFLQAPDYTPALEVTDRGNTKYADITNYPVNAAAIRMLGEWFEFLKQNRVYDNTRIIIVSDHGAGINLGIFSDEGGLPFLREEYNPLLLVKDFNAGTAPLITDNTFMTQADVPAIALSGVVKDPVNPFTGKPVISTAKETGSQKICISGKWSPHEHGSHTFTIMPNEWYMVHDNIFDKNNWSRAE